MHFQGAAGALQGCAQHILMMINAVRDSLCMLTGKLDLSITYVQVKPIILEIMKGLRLTMMNARRAGSVQVAVNVADGALCYCDMDRFKHITHVLLANAVKYTKKGYIKVLTPWKRADYLL
jgi:signal transduction histidine kinase